MRLLSVIWEPACGKYAISDILKQYGHNVISTDLIYGEDYFTTHKTGIDAVITNPPFNMAEQFIKKSIADAPLSAMLVKATYWHASKRTKLFETNPPAYILPLNWRPNFFGEKATGSPTMDFMWSVWIRGNSDTKYKILKRP